MATRTARILGGVGRTLMTAGVLVLLFSAFQLWGTSLAEGQAQDGLEETFEQRRAALAATAAPAPPPSTAAPPASVPGDVEPEPPMPVAPLPPELVPALGETAGRIVIPAIGVDKYVVEGVRRSDLRRGPGHFPDTPLPGQAGNAAIAGHRTTYGAPFGDLDRLVPGDEIIVETLQGTFSYRVMPHDGPDGTEVGHFIVDPYAGVVVLADHGDHRLTLTACHPKYSAAQRIVVTAELAGAPAPGVDDGDAVAGAERDGTDGAGTDEDPPPAGSEPPAEEAASAATDDDMGLEESMGWNLDGLSTTAGWAAVTAAAAAVVAAAGRRWRRWPAWALGGPVVGLALFVTFGHLDRMLPAL